MPLTGEAKAEYNRRHYIERKRKRADAQTVRETLVLRPRHSKVIEAIAGGASVNAALIGAGYDGSSKTMRGLLKDPESDLGRALRQTLEARGLTLDRVVGKIADKMEATRHQTIAGDAIVSDDNDAQLRATDQALRLHERAGTIPGPQPAAGGGGGVHYHLHLQGLSDLRRAPQPVVVDAPDNVCETLNG